MCVASASLRSPSRTLRRSRRSDRINVRVIMREGYFSNTESMGNSIFLTIIFSYIYRFYLQFLILLDWSQTSRSWKIIQRCIIKINNGTYPYLIKRRLYNYLLSPSRVSRPSNYVSIGDRPLRWTGFLGRAEPSKLHYGRIHEKCQIVARGQPWPGLTGSWLAGSLFLFLFTDLFSDGRYTIQARSYINKLWASHFRCTRLISLVSK